MFFCLIQRNGADFSVFVNTANEFDGSDSGAAPDEAISWGKIKMTSKPVKVSSTPSQKLFASSSSFFVIYLGYGDQGLSQE